jgi:P4 family phage/plasmid primase-like protien
MVVCSEVNQTARFNEAKVKLLTGGDQITARFLYHEHFTFQPTHQLWLMANHQPRVDAGGEGFWRRLRLIPFTRTVPAARRIDGLAEVLAEQEGAGILAWIVSGARQVLADGLAEPPAVLAATALYAEEEDALGRFVAERCRIGGGQQVRIDTRELRGTYEQWCFLEGEKPISPQLLGRELRGRFDVGHVKSNGRRFYTNLTLLGTEGHDADERPEQLHWTDR